MGSFSTCLPVDRILLEFSWIVLAYFGKENGKVFEKENWKNFCPPPPLFHLFRIVNEKPLSLTVVLSAKIFLQCFFMR